MRGRLTRYAAVAILGLTVVAMVSGGAADAKKKKKPIDGARLIAGSVTEDKLSAAVQAKLNDQGAPPPAAGGSALTVNFNARLTANQVKSVTIGNHTAQVAADAGGLCVGGGIVVGATDSQIATNTGGFSTHAANTFDNFLSANDSDSAVAISTDGASTMVAYIGNVTQGAACLASGTVAGV